MISEKNQPNLKKWKLSAGDILLVLIASLFFVAIFYFGLTIPRTLIVDRTFLISPSLFFIQTFLLIVFTIHLTKKVRRLIFFIPITIFLLGGVLLFIFFFISSSGRIDEVFLVMPIWYALTSALPIIATYISLFLYLRLKKG